MGGNRLLSGLVDFLYRKTGENPASLRTFLLYGFIAGFAGVLVDLDHIVLFAYLWLYGKMPD